MRFGVGIPTCREGVAYPVPYVRPGDFVSIARHAEALGYYSLWANDHLTTPTVVQSAQEAAPNFYEPLITYASLASVTQRLRFVLSIVVLPQRNVVLMAKQVATLDVLTGGRVMLGVGIGSYREEFEAVHPKLKQANRGAMLEEGIQALQLLFSRRRAKFDGKYVRFGEIELAPKPAQRPFPIYLSAHEPVGLRRAGRMADGLILAALDHNKVPQVRKEMSAAAVESGRDPSQLSVHFQIWLSFGKDLAAAEEKLKRSQHFRRMVAKGPNLSEAAVLAQYRAGNLLGSPDDVVRQLRVFQRAGVSHMGIIFLGNTTDELLNDMDLFARQVIPTFN